MMSRLLAMAKPNLQRDLELVSPRRRDHPDSMRLLMGALAISMLGGSLASGQLQAQFEAAAEQLDLRSLDL